MTVTSHIKVWAPIGPRDPQLFQLTSAIEHSVECGVGAVFEPFSFSLDTAVTLWACGSAIAEASDTWQAMHDPPDRGFKRVVAIRPFPLPHVPPGCSHLYGAVCHTLRLDEQQLLYAMARVDSISEAVSITANRYVTAIAHGDIAHAKLQARAEVGYLRRLIAAIKQRGLAGKRLAYELIAHHLNGAVWAHQVTQSRIRASRLEGMPRWMILRLIRDRIVADRAELKHVIDTLLGSAPAPKATTIAALFAAGYE